VVASLIKFAQGASNPPAGQALMGVTGTPVIVSNANDSGVAKWVFEVIDVPPGSSVPVGVVQSGSTPTWAFTPDLVDGYLIQLTTIDPTGQIMAVDTRAFGVLRPSGRFIPPFTATASALNFGGQTRGWAVYMEQWLEYLDGLAAGAGSLGIYIPTVASVVVTSSASTLSGSIAVRILVYLETSYTAGVLNIGNTTDATLFMGAGLPGAVALDLTSPPGIYPFDVLVPCTADKVTVTPVGAAGGGALKVIVQQGPVQT
jgi:hypothetical protein